MAALPDDIARIKAMVADLNNIERDLGVYFSLENRDGLLKGLYNVNNVIEGEWADEKASNILNALAK